MTEYTPDALVAQFLAGSADVLPWVAAGVGGGITLMFAFLGIRAGFRFFQEVANNNRAARHDYDDMLWAQDQERAREAGFGYGVVDFDDGPVGGSVSDAEWGRMTDDEKDTEIGRQSAAGTW